MPLFDDDRSNRSSIPGRDSVDLRFNSFSGTDIQCFLFDAAGPADQLRSIEASESLSAEQKQIAKQRVVADNSVKTFGELQTLTVSVASSFGPVRRLGEREVVQYKGGARTVAGSMIFAVLNRDVFAKHMQGKLAGSTAGEWRSPNYVDEIPEFNVLVQGGNEFGHFASGLLIGVKLTNFGTTFSVDDLYTESTYNYVARHYIPFTDNWKKTIYDQLVIQNRTKPLSSTVQDDNEFLQVHGEMAQINRNLYAWWNTLPPLAREAARDALPGLQDKLFKKFAERRMNQ